jgi:hypothetical protein
MPRAGTLHRIISGLMQRKARQDRRRGETAVMYGAAGEWLEEQPLRDRQGKSAIKIGKACAAGKIVGAPSWNRGRK